MIGFMVDPSSVSAPPTVPHRRGSKRGLVVVGITLLVLWAAAVATLLVVGMIEHMQFGPQQRAVGGAEGMFQGIMCFMAVPCGVALLVALQARAVRTIRGLRWLVVVGLAMACFVPVAWIMDLFK